MLTKSNLFVRLLILGLAFVSAPSQAVMITIDADSYDAGSLLTGSLSHVNLTNGFRENVYASEFNCRDHAAPTGTRVFGLKPTAGCHGWASQTGGPFPTRPSSSALVGAFTDPVSLIEIDLLNFGYPAMFFAEYSLYDANYALISRGTANTPLGQAVRLTLTGANISYFDIGGFDSIAAIAVDRLSFEVPEPSTFSMILLALVGALAIGRRKFKPANS